MGMSKMAKANEITVNMFRTIDGMDNGTDNGEEKISLMI